MGAPYAQDLRDRILAAYDRGMPTSEIAKVFQVSASWARRVKQRRREHGETQPRAMGGATVVKVDTEQLRALVQQQPDATIKELNAQLASDCAPSTVGMALQRMALTLKKRQSWRANKTGRMCEPNVNTGKRSNPNKMPGG